jgi:hypothetical protein
LLTAPSLLLLCLKDQELPGAESSIARMATQQNSLVKLSGLSFMSALRVNSETGRRNMRIAFLKRPPKVDDLPFQGQKRFTLGINLPTADRR